jgi:hypothetical protein
MHIVRNIDDNLNERSPLRRSGRGSKLAPIGIALGGTLLIALAVTAIVTVAGLHFLHFQRFKTESQLSSGTFFNLLKIAFAVAAGIGGVVALVTAYRRQRIAEFAEGRGNLAENREQSRLFNERFTAAADQLGNDNPAIRLAGVYAMARLADDWPDQRQTCVDVLCAYLRMPYEPEPPEDQKLADRLAFQAVREVRHTVISVIASHLQPDESRASTVRSWRGLDFDFTGVVFDGGDFSGIEFTGGTARFGYTSFVKGTVRFHNAKFKGGRVSFGYAKFTGDCRVQFDDAQFLGARVDFGISEFSGGTVRFDAAEFREGIVYLGDCAFHGSTVRFTGAEFMGGTVDFDNTNFADGSRLQFDEARFTGGIVNFDRANFNGGIIDFRKYSDWATPPVLPSWEHPPAGVLLPQS